MKAPLTTSRDEIDESLSFARADAEERAGAAPRRAQFVESFAHAARGMIYAFSTQRNARVHLAAALAAITLGVALRLSPVEFAVVILAIVAVVAAEMINTVAETIVDLVTPDYHPLAKIAKDVAAGAVLWSAIGAVAVGVVIYGPHLLALTSTLLRH